jgi:hypothetical protein
MMDYPQWLPDLIHLNDYSGNWQKYIDYVFSIFYKDFIQSQPKFESKWVRCRRDPIFDGKEAGFWHCTSDGQDESQRIPDLRRCERIGWIRAIIENCEYKDILLWKSKKNSEIRVYLWFNEEYVVVLGVRNRFFQLITAFCTDRNHTRERLKKEYERSKNS